MVICIKLCSCSLLLSKGGIFGLLFLEIQSCFWFEYLYLFALSEKQNRPDLAITPLHMVCFQWAIWIRNTQRLLGCLPDNSLQQQVCLSALQGATRLHPTLQSSQEFVSSHPWHGSILCWNWCQSSTNYQIAVWWNCSTVSINCPPQRLFWSIYGTEMHLWCGQWVAELAFAKRRDQTPAPLIFCSNML